MTHNVHGPCHYTLPQHLEPGIFCSPRHRVSFNSVIEGPKCVRAGTEKTLRHRGLDILVTVLPRHIIQLYGGASLSIIHLGLRAAGDPARTNRPASWRAALRRRRSRARRVRRASPRRTRPPPPPCWHRCGRRYVGALFPFFIFRCASQRNPPHRCLGRGSGGGSGGGGRYGHVAANTSNPLRSSTLSPECRRVCPPPGSASCHPTAASARSSPLSGTTRIIYAGDGVPRASVAAAQQRLHRRQPGARGGVRARGLRLAPGMGVIENMHLTDVELSPAPPASVECHAEGNWNAMLLSRSECLFSMP